MCNTTTNLCTLTHTIQQCIVNTHSEVEYQNSHCFLILDSLAYPIAKASFVLATKHNNHLLINLKAFKP